MSSQQIQSFLNKLYLDEDFRHNFFDDRSRFYDQWVIREARIREFMEGLKHEQVEFFSKGLYAKRFHAMNTLLPLTLKYLGEDHKILFRDFSRTFYPEGIHKHHIDALKYCEFLKGTENRSTFFKNVLKFESDQLKNFLKPGKFQISFYTFHPLHLRKTLYFTGLVEQKGFYTLVFRINGAIKKCISPFKFSFTN